MKPGDVVGQRFTSFAELATALELADAIRTLTDVVKQCEAEGQRLYAAAMADGYPGRPRAKRKHREAEEWRNLQRRVDAIRAVLIRSKPPESRGPAPTLDG